MEKKEHLINNIDTFSERLLTFNETDTLYQLIVLERKKEGFDKDIAIKRYLISSKEEFEKLTKLCIQRYCTDKPRRLYVSVSPKTYTDTAIQIAYLAVKYIKHTGAKPKLSSITDDAFATTKSCENRYIIDVDNMQGDEETKKKHIDELVSFIKQYMNKIFFDDIVIMQTKGGYHIITKGFNFNNFKNDLKKHELLSGLTVELLPTTASTLLYLKY